ncbi:hypothetical protein DNTS_022043 [Danionella cerebrum]|uniref:Ferric-chelate reductase 1 n=1 Tax=Danionella cerebrum TaxID=2873325 RepID=A0A553R0X1_9TELE|nr:hypothetical protein DNTS_022043 [Danionella translucida]
METLMDKRIVALLISLCLETVICYSNGKVEVACEDMTPEHGYDPSTKDPPIIITADKIQFSTGDEVKVTLSMGPTDGKQYFKGFLVEARNAGKMDEIVGSFELIDLDESQLLTCNNVEGSAVSHTSESHKTHMQVIWVAPPDSPSAVQFLVTVAQGFRDFWVKIPGPVVSQSGVVQPPQTTIGGSTISKTTASSTMSRSITSDGCGIRKSCLRYPKACEPQIDAACHFLSFMSEGNSVVFELSGPAEGYVSFALSLDKWMGNDDVYLFRRDVLPPPADPHRFSLNQSFYIFMAHGRADDGRTHRHDRQPLISTFQTDINGPSVEVTGSRSPLVIKFHGAFMLIAWMSTVSAGVIMARHFKPDWPDSNILGQKVWFQLHRMLMTFTLLLTSVGFVLPFVYRNGWSKRAGIHPYMGCAVMALTVIQPIMALFRPAPDAARRYIFNWLHFGTGTVAQIMAVVTILLGIHQQALLLPAPWSTAVLAFTVTWFVSADLILELHRRGFLPIGQYFKNVKIYTEHINSDDKEEIVFVPDQSETRYMDSHFKNVVLAIYLCGNLVCVLFLLWTITSV